MSGGTPGCSSCGASGDGKERPGDAANGLAAAPAAATVTMPEYDAMGNPTGGTVEVPVTQAPSPTPSVPAAPASAAPVGAAAAAPPAATSVAAAPSAGASTPAQPAAAPATVTMPVYNVAGDPTGETYEVPAPSTAPEPVTAGTYQTTSVNLGVGSVGYTRAWDAEGQAHRYLTVGLGLAPPGVGFSGGGVVAQGNEGLDSYMTGSGYAASVGPVEVGANGSGMSAGYSVAVGANFIGSAQWTNTVSLTPGKIDTTSPTIDYPSTDALGTVNGTMQLPNPNYRPAP